MKKIIMLTTAIATINLIGNSMAADYLIMNLSDGSFTMTQAEDSSGFNNDECKTNKIVFRKISPHQFDMGRDGSVKNVQLTNPYYIAIFETTQKQAELLRDLSGMKVELDWSNNTRYYATGAKFPAYNINAIDPNNLRGNVSGHKAPTSTSFLGKLNANLQASLLDTRIDLPSEAEWEFAARANTSTRYFFGDNWKINGEELLYQYANAKYWSAANTKEVGSYKQSPWGLYDIYGNVWELTRDYYNGSALPTTQPNGDTYTVNSGSRAIRGGCSSQDYSYCDSFTRNSNDAATLGFRLVITGNVQSFETKAKLEKVFAKDIALANLKIVFENDTWKIRLLNDMNETFSIPDSLGKITLDMNGYSIITGKQDAQGNGNCGLLIEHDANGNGEGTVLTIENTGAPNGGIIQGADGMNGTNPGNGGSGINFTNAQNSTASVSNNHINKVQIIDGNNGKTLLAAQTETVKITAFKQNQIDKSWWLRFQVQMKANHDFETWQNQAIEKGKIKIACYNQLKDAVKIENSKNIVLTQDNTTIPKNIQNTLEVELNADELGDSDPQFFRVRIEDMSIDK